MTKEYLMNMLLMKSLEKANVFIFLKKIIWIILDLSPSNTTSTYYTMRMMMIIEKPSGRNEQSIIVGTWSWIGCEIRARTSFWEVSLLWCPGGPFADWPSMSSPHCWGAQCSKKISKSGVSVVPDFRNCLSQTMKEK